MGLGKSAMDDAMSSVSSMREIYKGKKVFLTGHTGFKGSWLALWLESMGAVVTGYALAPEGKDSHFELLTRAGQLKIKSHIADIRDLESVKRAINEAQPEIVFHLAAQPIVLKSYRDPIETFETNVMGTLKVLEAARACESVRVFINVTSDKCYENREWDLAYRENDPMGGYDPYSASKGCAEVLASSYQRSFFSDGRILMASVRAGNVIGGGDWADNRIVPDVIRAFIAGTPAEIRNPAAIRPWQHVLEPLHGYLKVGARLLSGDKSTAIPFNFGPDPEMSVPVGELLTGLTSHWPELRYKVLAPAKAPHEAHFLRLDSTRARTQLGWKPQLSLTQTIEWTADWYREFAVHKRVISVEQLGRFVERIDKQ